MIPKSRGRQKFSIAFDLLNLAERLALTRFPTVLSTEGSDNQRRESPLSESGGRPSDLTLSKFVVFAQWRVFRQPGGPTWLGRSEPRTKQWMSFRRAAVQFGRTQASSASIVGTRAPAPHKSSCPSSLVRSFTATTGAGVDLTELALGVSHVTSKSCNYQRP